jgi:hypothetical protein
MKSSYQYTKYLDILKIIIKHENMKCIQGARLDIQQYGNVLSALASNVERI